MASTSVTTSTASKPASPKAGAQLDAGFDYQKRDPVKILTNLISLVRHSVDPEHQPLAPFPKLVNARFSQWLSDQQKTEQPETGKPRFTETQVHWLKVIRDYVALNGAFATDDQDDYLEAWQSVDTGEGVPLAVAKRVFGQDPKSIIEELNRVVGSINAPDPHITGHTGP
jgi:hypothetical protein